VPDAGQGRATVIPASVDRPRLETMKRKYFPGCAETAGKSHDTKVQYKVAQTRSIPIRHLGAHGVVGQAGSCIEYCYGGLSMRCGLVSRRILLPSSPAPKAKEGRAI
jgi:hypothetical protein